MKEWVDRWVGGWRMGGQWVMVRALWGVGGWMQCFLVTFSHKKLHVYCRKNYHISCCLSCSIPTAGSVETKVSESPERKAPPNTLQWRAWNPSARNNLNLAPPGSQQASGASVVVCCFAHQIIHQVLRIQQQTKASGSR